MEISLPAACARVLSQKNNLSATVHACLAWVTPILNRNQAFFFPEYTDHGIEHINRVIGTAWSLAHPASQESMKAEDCAVLVLSAVLHDFAMHLGCGGFVNLVADKTAHRSIPWFQTRFDERPWGQLWKEFSLETTRWDARRCTSVYGNPECIRLPDIGNLLTHDWSVRERQIVGEFIRRHHGRMAHEFATYGFPTGMNGAVTAFVPQRADMEFNWVSDLSGLIARSHSLPLRTSVDYLRSLPMYNRNVRNPYDCHAPFLMSLLRIADYIQVDADRAPIGPVELLTELRSPVSRREWKTHIAVEQIHFEHPDPECIEVLTRPKDVETYLNTRQLLDGIQDEIDQSWAVMGEVYGTPDAERTRLFPAALIIRRIRSNLDDLQLFAKTVDYIPKLAQFTVAAPRMVELLVKPLYGDKPSIGLRELIQNAVDAVQELRDIRSNLRGTASYIDQTYDLDGHDVRISIESDPDGTKWLVCTDAGRGMTDTVINDYFLNVGSSFRMSDAWRSIHEREAGKPQFARSGRFGIGVLAAFLMGNKLQCTTRAYDQPRGITFEATPDTGIIELRHVNSPVGTSIRVLLGNEPEKAPGKILQRWYFGSECSVQYAGVKYDTDPTRTLASQASSPPGPGWLRMPQKEFDAVDWSPTEFSSSLFCNGLRIRELGGSLQLDQNTQRKTLSMPSVSFVDNVGRLPLRLDRLDLAGKLPLEDLLKSECIDNLLSFWMVFAGQKATIGRDPSPFHANRQKICRPHLPISPLESYTIPEVFSPNGVWPWDIFVGTPTLDSPTVFEMCLKHPGSAEKSHSLNWCRQNGEHTVHETMRWLRSILSNSSDGMLSIKSKIVWLVLGEHWCREKFLKYLPVRSRSRMTCLKTGTHGSVFQIGQGAIPTEVGAVLDERSDYLDRYQRLAVCIFDENALQSRTNRFAKRWREVIGGPIPLVDNERHELIERVRKMPGFAAHLAFWESYRENKKEPDGAR